MYMMTRGNSNIPLIKLSEGFGVKKLKNNRKEHYVTIVCGSNGEKLVPVRTWKEDNLFNFFNKEKLNAEFISKTELVYVQATIKDAESKIEIEISKYKIPEFVINNMELSYESIRSIKPEIETLFRITMSYDMEMISTIIENPTNYFYDFMEGKFSKAIGSSLYKLNNKEQLCYAEVK